MPVELTQEGYLHVCVPLELTQEGDLYVCVPLELIQGDLYVCVPVELTQVNLYVRVPLEVTQEGDLCVTCMCATRTYTRRRLVCNVYVCHLNVHKKEICV